MLLNVYRREERIGPCNGCGGDAFECECFVIERNNGPRSGLRCQLDVSKIAVVARTRAQEAGRSDEVCVALGEGLVHL